MWYICRCTFGYGERTKEHLVSLAQDDLGGYIETFELKILGRNIGFRRI